MFFFTFAVYLELFERVRSCFGVGYTLRCRIRVLNYNYAAATRCVSIDTQGVDRTDYELFIYTSSYISCEGSDWFAGLSKRGTPKLRTH